MAEVLLEYEAIVAGADGGRWSARVCGRPGGGDMWEGWIEFVPLDPERRTVRTRRETTQPSREDLQYWATGLTPVYLEGALARAETPRDRPHRPLGPRSAILDPFDVYAQGEDILLRQLDALDTSRLRDIVRAYELMKTDEVEGATRLDLATTIVTAARESAHQSDRARSAG
ncbi:MAG TPA: hypothetical protein VMQ78_06380 [Candidatus Limnocylindria bacterium]|nr:hypothetical protein [Candidatus Limnocylindria bacterium]